MAGSFVTVACPECDNEQTLFTKAATTVECAECDATLATPTGGEAAIQGEVREVVEAR
jgi:small subunit ribosomal protein S27e